MTELSAVPRRCVQRRYGFIFPRYNAPRCNAALDALRPAPEFTPRHFKQDDAERQGRDSNAERVEPDIFTSAMKFLVISIRHIEAHLEKQENIKE